LKENISFDFHLKLQSQYFFFLSSSSFCFAKKKDFLFFSKHWMTLKRKIFFQRKKRLEKKVPLCSKKAFALFAFVFFLFLFVFAFKKAKNKQKLLEVHFS
jgi:hypothetical protein